ncbi:MULTISPECIES: 30S ribosomal protein S21 [Maribacter]|uniref:Small ribosomal subunit protein bS21 n=2 Tax=Maribacter TaxID=252356 RepID=A0A5B2U091_9FLAO|nr:MULTISPECIES: 30S ribosomal protein S21 [Maribacter]KAA2219763.1 30S ribosomal protein S21 [Maribacter flavus]MDC6405323.1 30S ribosomal protein S21 [Maribacter sp. PR66]MEE1971868.1 30S ribosomal protein S21 [Maribacter flavus]TLF46995.1 30S ribosomal protein S21 [Maribacter aurantiacus]
MLKIEVKEGESIERALKRYKRKYRRTKVLDKIKENQYYTKQSTERREALQKAEYKQQYLLENEDQ